MEIRKLNYNDHAKLRKPTGSLVVFQATRFWIREDVVDEDRDQIDIDVMRPLTQLGGVSYGSVRETFALLRHPLTA